MEIKNLSAYLANIGMTVKDFSVILDIDRAYLSQISNGHKIPSRRLARDIRIATGGVIDIPANPKKEKKQQSAQI